MNFKTDIFMKFDKEWALLTAGSLDDHNAMTISWGGMGTLWHKPVVTVYVKPVRHTYEYMEKNDYFTVSFYPERYRKALMLMGSKTGRDCDKDKEAGLTAETVGESVTYKEAEITLLCRKIYFNDLDTANMSAAVVRANYTAEAPHRMYLGEVIGIIEK